MKQTCEVTVDGLEMRPVLVLALCKRVPNDIGDMLDQLSLPQTQSFHFLVTNILIGGTSGH